MEIKTTHTTLYNCDCIAKLKDIEDGSIDLILTDPPYLYLKHKLDIPFDETAFFSECKRVLKRGGFIVMFGRGSSFYRWNTMLADLGFTFKEEIVWDKMYSTSPLTAISRMHETVSIHSLGDNKINKVKVPYLEMKALDYASISNDVKRISSALNNPTRLNDLRQYIESGSINYTKCRLSQYGITAGKTMPSMKQHTATLHSVFAGMNEKSIIRITRDHYKTVHPTQKPVRLLERLIALTLKDGGVVLDPFMGGGSTGIAAVNMGCNFIGMEIDEEYYNAAKDRIMASDTRLL